MCHRVWLVGYAFSFLHTSQPLSCRHHDFRSRSTLHPPSTAGGGKFQSASVGRRASGARLGSKPTAPTAAGTERQQNGEVHNVIKYISTRSQTDTTVNTDRHPGRQS